MSFQSHQSRISQWIAASRASLTKAARALSASCAMAAAALCLVPAVASAATIPAVVTYDTSGPTHLWKIRWNGVNTGCSSVVNDFPSVYFNFYIDGVKYVGKSQSFGFAPGGGGGNDYEVAMPFTWPNGTFQGATIGRIGTSV